MCGGLLDNQGSACRLSFHKVFLRVKAQFLLWLPLILVLSHSVLSLQVIDAESLMQNSSCAPYDEWFCLLTDVVRCCDILRVLTRNLQNIEWCMAEPNGHAPASLAVKHQQQVLKSKAQQSTNHGSSSLHWHYDITADATTPGLWTCCQQWRF